MAYIYIHTLSRKAKSVHSDNLRRKLVGEEKLLKDLMQHSKDKFEYNLVYSSANQGERNLQVC